MMPFHFADYLTREWIMGAAGRHRLANPAYLEKFVMDFELGYHLMDNMRCILRGGMCMPFHTDRTLHRLSIDVDLFTPRTVEETDEVVMTMGDEMEGVDITRKNPKRPHPIPNLVSYDVTYDCSR